ncbi:hypothetical protein AGABI1DRAFT_123842 [Agaricus bisporus var. burnettii JB137-S8]|uniref:Uncharacterized protein n=1 Tax=Agaricus bisporus var. burnettii (strain JB137-S8 / ATCC MYA-4627 / FGSC 10392) TaxID=597362 RepID=K5X6K5_AGABU|nr:uncharacterized protein AGABI1DRAFT_123842 [Agaricus bisporus var. burnettii JB137-S8]EKM83516.1 hypothetical protein AGABI1DRAFT_123842 [Agaricus bisporus var. burnettii JB137-S8]
MLASPKRVESADAQVAFREMYYSRLLRGAYPMKAYHHRRALMEEATGVAGSDDTQVVGKAIGRQAFLLGEVLRHAEDGRVLRQPLDSHDRQTPRTSCDELMLQRQLEEDIIDEMYRQYILDC